MKYFRLLILLFMLGSPSIGIAQFQFTEGCSHAYSLVFDLQFKQASDALNREKQRMPVNHMIPLIENYIDFLKVFISEDEALFRSLYPNRQSRLKVLSQASDEDPMKRLALAVIQLQWAMVKLKFGQQLSAAWEIRSSFQLIAENISLFPDHLPNRIAMGVLYSIIGSIPPNYQWIIRLASMHGTVDGGSQMLIQVFEDCRKQVQWQPMQAEVLFYLTYIEINLRPDKTNAKRLIPLFETYDTLPYLLLYAKANLKMHLGENDAALNILNGRDRSVSRFPFAYLEYLTAECYLRKLQTQKAEVHYRRFLRESTGKNYLADAQRKIAWSRLLQGSEDDYTHEISLILANHADEVDADKQALRERYHGLIPDIKLLQARLLFDGGYYDDAAEALLAVDNTNKLTASRKVEYYYRLARIRHEQNILSEAKDLYRITVLEGRNLPEFYAANAALKLGEIFESMGNMVLSEQYYTTCLTISPEEYRTSIHLKAKAGLSRLKSMQ
jgi:tetratricopeptide (TPR) repeat protein